MHLTILSLAKQRAALTTSYRNVTVICILFPLRLLILTFGVRILSLVFSDHDDAIASVGKRQCRQERLRSRFKHEAKNGKDLKVSSSSARWRMR